MSAREAICEKASWKTRGVNLEVMLTPFLNEDYNKNCKCVRSAASLQTADVFPVVASNPPKIILSRFYVTYHCIL